MRRIVVGTNGWKSRGVGWVAHRRRHARGRGVAHGRSTTIFDGCRVARSSIIAGWQVSRAPIPGSVETGMRSSPSGAGAGAAGSGREEKTAARAGCPPGRFVACAGGCAEFIE